MTLDMATAAQALVGCACTTLFNSSGADQRLLFLISAASVATSLAMDFMQIAARL